MTNGKRHRRTETRQRPIAVARQRQRVPLNALSMLLGLLIVILVLGKSGVLV
jgi:hypothetical protein